MDAGARETRVVRGSRGLEGGRETGKEEKVGKEKMVEEEGPAGAELDMGRRYDRPLLGSQSLSAACPPCQR